MIYLERIPRPHLELPSKSTTIYSLQMNTNDKQHIHIIVTSQYIAHFEITQLYLIFLAFIFINKYAQKNIFFFRRTFMNSLLTEEYTNANSTHRNK